MIPSGIGKACWACLHDATRAGPMIEFRGAWLLLLTTCTQARRQDSLTLSVTGRDQEQKITMPTCMLMTCVFMAFETQDGSKTGFNCWCGCRS